MASHTQKLKYYLDSIGRLITDFLESDLFLKITLGVFLVEAVSFAIFIKLGLPPDENYQFSYIQLFAAHFPSPFLPNQGTNNVILEGVKNPFFLYNYLLSLPYYFIKSFKYSYVVIRLFSVAMSFSSLIITKQIADKLKPPKLVRNISIFMVCNTLMYVFISSSISYDNLFILITLGCVLITIDLFNKINVTKVLLLGCLLLAGLLVKVNFIPIAAIILLILLVKYIHQLKSSATDIKNSFVQHKKINSWLVLAFVALSSLFIYHYALNVIDYGTYAPRCDKVRSLQDCRKNALFARDERLTQETKPKLVSKPRYGLTWFNLMIDRTYGIFAHKRFDPSRLTILFIRLLLIGGFISLGFAILNRRLNKLYLLLIVSGFYMIILLVQNYKIYTSNGRLSLAIHGRYAFNVLPLLYLILNFSIFDLFKKPVLRAAVAILLITFFVLSNIPVFLIKTSPQWFINNYSFLHL